MVDAAPFGGIGTFPGAPSMATRNSPKPPAASPWKPAGALSWIGRWYNPEGRLNPDEIADQSIALLMSGVQQRHPMSKSNSKKAAVRKSK